MRLLVLQADRWSLSKDYKNHFVYKCNSLSLCPQSAKQTVNYQNVYKIFIFENSFAEMRKDEERVTTKSGHSISNLQCPITI